MQIGRRRHRQGGGVIGLGGIRGVVLEHLPLCVGGNAELEPADARATGRPDERQFPIPELAIGKRAQRRTVVADAALEHGLTGAGIAHHDAVAPVGAGRADSGVAVAPAQGHLGAGTPAAGRADVEVGNLQVGVRRQRRRQRDAGRVVELGRAAGALLEHRVLDIGSDPEHQIAGATVAVGQGEVEAVAARRARLQRAVDGLVVRDQLGEDEFATVVANDDLILPATAAGHAADVAGVPAQADRAARMQVAGNRRDRQVGHHQIGPGLVADGDANDVRQRRG